MMIYQLIVRFLLLPGMGKLQQFLVVPDTSIAAAGGDTDCEHSISPAAEPKPAAPVAAT